MVMMSTEVDKLGSALVKVQAEINDVTKDSTGQIGNRAYVYADLASVLEVTRPVLSKNGLAIVQFPCSTPTKIGVDTMIIHESGQWMRQRILIAVEAHKGISLAQAVGAAITYLRRYSITAVTGIAQVDNDAAKIEHVDLVAPSVLVLEKMIYARKNCLTISKRILDHYGKVHLHDLSEENALDAISKLTTKESANV